MSSTQYVMGYFHAACLVLLWKVFFFVELFDILNGPQIQLRGKSAGEAQTGDISDMSSFVSV